MTTAPPSRAGFAGLWFFLFALVVPVSAGEGTEVFGHGSEWSYWDQGTRPGAVETVGFDDSGWARGEGPLGYGDEGMSTVVGYGPDHDNKYITTYFRKRFEVADGLASRTLVLRYQRDDGIRIFLNGVEIHRENLPQRVTSTTLATRSLGGEESDVVEVEIDAPLLRDGENVLMAEVHQASPASADLRFDLGLSVIEAERDYEGAGTEEEPFRIENVEQFVRIGQRPGDWDKHFLLTGFFSLREVENYRPIGSGWGAEAFSGVFDGAGITLQQFTYEGEVDGPVGLFGVVTGTLKNIRLFGCNVGGPDRDFVGALVGSCEGRMENCQAVNVVAQGRSRVGGLAGLARYAERCSARSVDVTGSGVSVGGMVGVANVVRESWSLGRVSGGSYTGGLAGKIMENVQQSFSKADVWSPSGPAGGLVGLLSDSTEAVQDCYATGNVSVEGEGGAGGLVGLSEESSVLRSYATGGVVAPGAAGGLIGRIVSPWGENEVLFWDRERSGLDVGVGVGGDGDAEAVTGLTSDEMRSATPFVRAGWSFEGVPESGEEGVWKQVEESTPRLWWEEEPGVEPDGARTNLVAWGSEWRYWDRGVPPEGWQLPFFRDLEWKRGRAELGYGDGDEATTVSFGESAENKHVTTYFRREFLHGTGKVPHALLLEVKRDDGVRVFLNGEEILRDSLPEGEIVHTTLATAVAEGDGNRLLELALPPGALHGGHNVFSVEVHQVNATSSDLSFDLRLSALIDRPDYPGEGTEDDPFRLSSAAQLMQFSKSRNDWDNHVLVTDDIDLTGLDLDELLPIGEVGGRAFTGTFDGGGHAVFGYRNLPDNDGDEGRLILGLFGQNDGTICNLTISGFDVGSPWDNVVGALARYSGGSIKNCHAIGGRVVGLGTAGGLVGDAYLIEDCSAVDVNVDVRTSRAGGLAGVASQVSGCWSSGEIVGGSQVGGLVGFLVDEAVFCFSVAESAAREGTVGGLVGTGNDRPNLVHRCYAWGGVTSDSESGSAGGLIGYLSESSISNCFAAAEVAGRGSLGGLIGKVSSTWGANEGSFWDVETSGQPSAVGTIDDPADLRGMVGLSNVEARTPVPFLEAGWDYVLETGNGEADVWKYVRASYPRLWWEEPVVAGGDTDDDGLDDAWETGTFGDLAQNAEGDFDDDGLSNGRESELGTDGAGSDSDGDGFGDGLEVAFGSDPLDAEDTPRRLGEKLLAGGGGVGDLLGSDVAISGDAAVLGAPGERAAYVFRRVWHRWRDGGPRWEQVARLDDGTDGVVVANTGFGASVAVHGRWVAVGSPGLDTVFLYQRIEGGELRQAGQVSVWDDPVTAEMDFGPGAMAFGADVAMHDGVLVVGSPSFLGSGMAYVYERREGEWEYGGRLESKLDPVAFRPMGEYGQAVAVHGKRAVVLTPTGARVHVFERRESRWEESTELWVEGVVFPAGVRGDVAVYRGRVAAVGIGDPGKVYLWRRGDGDQWQVEAPVETSAVQLDSVGLWGNTLVSGAGGDRSFGVQSGAAYVFKRGRWGREGWGWELDQTLFPRDAMAEKDFGFAVAVGRNQTLVGAPRDGENGERAGAGYVFGQQRFRWFRDWVWRHHREGGGGVGGGGRDALMFALGDDVFGWSDEEAAPSLVAGVGENGGVPCLTFTFTMPDPVPADVEYEVQVSSGLRGLWEKVASRGVDGEWGGEATVTEHVAADGRVGVVVHDVVPLGDARERFVRLVVRVVDGP